MTKRHVTAAIRYFKCNLSDQDKNWTAHVKSNDQFIDSVIRRMPTNHSTDSCLSKTSGSNSNGKNKIEYLLHIQKNYPH